MSVPEGMKTFDHTDIRTSPTIVVPSFFNTFLHVARSFGFSTSENSLGMRTHVSITG